MKRILIDGTSVSRKMDGLSQYILNITWMLGENHNENSQYTLLIRPGECKEFYLQHFRSCGIQIVSLNIPPIGLLREWRMWVYLNKNEGSFDIIYIPSNQYPFFLKGGIFTIHDLIYEQFPQQLGRFAKIKKIYLHWIVKHGLKHSKYIIAVSNYTKKESCL
jgi:hypothetical protein